MLLLNTLQFLRIRRKRLVSAMRAHKRDRSNTFNRYVYQCLWFVSLFVFTDGFGWRENSWGGAGEGGSIGWFGFLQLIIFASSLLTLPFAVSVSMKIFLPAFRLGMLSLLASPFYLLFLLFFHGATGLAPSALESLSNITALKSQYSLYLFIFLLSRPGGVTMGFNQIQIWALFASFTALLFALTGYETAVFRQLASESDMLRQFRILMPQAALCVLGWTLFGAKYIAARRPIDGIFCLVCLLALLTQMHRGVLLSSGVALFYLVWVWFKTGAVSNQKVVRAIFALLAVPPMIWLLIPSSIIQIVVNMIDLSIFEANVSKGAFITSKYRYEIVINSFNQVVAQTGGAGFGFFWKAFDLQDIVAASYVQAVTLDSTFANLLITGGIPAVIFAGILFSSAFLVLRSIHAKSEENIILKVSVTSSLLFLLINGISTDILFTGTTTPFCMLLLAILAVKSGALGKRKYDNCSA